MSPLQATQKGVSDVLGLLAETVERIVAASTDRPEAELRRAPMPGEWSPVDILAHLRGCDEVWTGTIYAMLAYDRPELPDMHPRPYAKAARYAELDFHPSFQTFALRRQELLQVLRLLPQEKWERSADLDGRKHTVFSQARRMALHEAAHCEEIENILRNSKAGAP